MSERLHIDESSLAPAPPAPTSAPPASPADASPWPSGLRNPAVLTPPGRQRTDPRTLAIIGGLCGSIVLAGASYVAGRASGPSDAEISARIERAIAADRAKRPAAAPTPAPARTARSQRPAPTTPKGRP